MEKRRFSSVCSGKDFSDCATATGGPPGFDPAQPPGMSGRVFDCEMGGMCLEVPFVPFGEYRFLATPAPP
jgi:hypothetical protein